MTDTLKKTEAESALEFSSVEEIVADLRIGKMVIIVDDEEKRMKATFSWLQIRSHQKTSTLWPNMAED